MLTIENVEVSFEVHVDDDEEKLMRLIQICVNSEMKRNHAEHLRERVAHKDRSLVPRSEETA